MKALVAVSFGTSVPEARCAIENVEKAIKEQYPDRDFFRAYTSKIICRKLQSEGENICGISERLEELKNLGYDDILIQPTHIIQGIEYDLVVAEAEEFQGQFSSVKIGEPLIYDTEDLKKIAGIVVKAWMPEEGNLLLMGHGTDHRNNMVYLALQAVLSADYPGRVFVATVEGYPELSDIVGAAKASGNKKITLAPFMLVAGDHARNDMAGDEENSWKRQLTAEGFDVDCILEGLGNIPEIQNMYSEKAGAI